MNDQLLHLIIKQKATLVAICIIIALLVMVFLLWMYAEITFYRQKYNELLVCDIHSMTNIFL